MEPKGADENDQKIDLFCEKEERHRKEAREMEFNENEFCENGTNLKTLAEKIDLFYQNEEITTTLDLPVVRVADSFVSRSGGRKYETLNPEEE